MKKSLSKLVLVLIATAALPSSALASTHHPPMSYVGSALASSVYFPAKVLFAVGGAVTSGIAYVATLGNPEPSREIWDASVEGDYVVTPSMIEGHEDVDFVGS